MTRSQLQAPFGDEPCEDVPLPVAPLVRVLAQLRFDPLAVLDSPNSASLFAAEIGKDYPYLEKGAEFNMLITPGQVSPQMGQNAVWRFRSPDRKTVVSLSNGSLALETSVYGGRTEFCSALSSISAALKKVAYVPAYTRIGYRYTNRVVDQKALAKLPSLIRPEILGISGVQLDGRADLQHSLAQASFKIDASRGLLAQWGEMPPGGTFDPSLSSFEQRSWVLDLDSFYQSSEVSSDPEEVRRRAEMLSDSAYRFFRWAVTDDFLLHFGGKL
ncbi:TIGR04255 family protein [Streptomyces rhizosphaericola]|uniref:TIGR04255 family protein n=1 Tax=Streptomyces rhizosphaericola TaxID=2564098 RepID=UPI0036820157